MFPITDVMKDCHFLPFCYIVYHILWWFFHNKEKKELGTGGVPKLLSPCPSYYLRKIPLLPHGVTLIQYADDLSSTKKRPLNTSKQMKMKIPTKLL